MVQLIMGLKGSGKTKRLIEQVNNALQASDYSIGTVEFFKGLLSGLHAGNYDITHIFIDNFVKMMPGVTEAEIEEFLIWLDAFSEKESVKFTVSMTLNPDEVSENIRKYIV